MRERVALVRRDQPQERNIAPSEISSSPFPVKIHKSSKLLIAQFAHKGFKHTAGQLRTQ